MAEVVDVIQLPAFRTSDRSGSGYGQNRRGHQCEEAAVPGAARNAPSSCLLKPATSASCYVSVAQVLATTICGGYAGYGRYEDHGAGKVIFDATHALQRPGGRTDPADGRRQQAFQLARSGMALGIAGLFLGRRNPELAEAKCDGPCALPLDKLEVYLEQMKAVDSLVKSFAKVIIDWIIKGRVLLLSGALVGHWGGMSG